MNMLGVRIDDVGKDEALLRLESFVEKNRRGYVVTPNPEMLVTAQSDAEFASILNDSLLSIPDGIGLVLASYAYGHSLKERVAGTDLMKDICFNASRLGWRILLLGGENGVSQKAVDNLKGTDACLNILALENSCLEDPWKINSFCEGKTILFVALGAPYQEKWISRNMSRMPEVNLAMGVGGAFDFLAGKIRRAPCFVRFLGLEWLWRFILQPWRVKRMARAIIVFPWLVSKNLCHRI